VATVTLRASCSGSQEELEAVRVQPVLYPVTRGYPECLNIMNFQHRPEASGLLRCQAVICGLCPFFWHGGPYFLS